MKSRYLVFLDIDGVFTSSRVHYAHKATYNMWHRFDPVAIDFMNRIHDTYTVEFVLISTWKNQLKTEDANIEHWIRAAFGNSGFRGNFANPWKTDPDNLGIIKDKPYNRAHEIKDYLALYGDNVKDFIIFDDNDYLFEQVLGKRRLVRTDTENGLLFKHMRNAQSIMGTWIDK